MSIGNHGTSEISYAKSARVGPLGSTSSTAADAPAGGKASPPPHEASLPGGGVGGGRFAARTVAVRSYPRVRSSPHLPSFFEAGLGCGMRDSDVVFY